MIEIKGLKKSFGDLHVLKGIDLHIDEREVVRFGQIDFAPLHKFFGRANRRHDYC